jgi:hypothetical protein
MVPIAAVLPSWRRRAALAALTAVIIVLPAAALAAAPESPDAAVGGRVVTWGGGLVGAEQDLLPPADLDDAVAVAASGTYGSAYDLALRSDGTVIGWGRDPDGAASPPKGLSGVVAIDTGAGFSVALRRDGSVAAWGSNATGQSAVPEDLGQVTAVSAGGFTGKGGVACGFGLALTVQGTVVRWGSEPDEDSCYGQLGASLDPPAGLHDVVAISAGNRQALALEADGTVVGWGQNGAGQATPPDGLGDVVAIAAGVDHSLALQANGTVVGWGVWGESGAPNVKDATAIASSWGDVILRKDGSIYLWTGSTWGDQPTGTDYLAVAAGYGHGAAIERPATDPATESPSADPTQTPIGEGDASVPAVGSTDLQPFVDENPPGTAEAFRSVATAGGTSRQLKLYVDASSAAGELVAGVYADAGGRPGQLLASGRISSPIAGAWNTVTLPPSEITAGTAYWLALLGPTGTGPLRFRDLVDGRGGSTQISAETDLEDLPSSWRSGQAFANAPASAHLILG